jgi:lysophospholipase L1-like esterase
VKLARLFQQFFIYLGYFTSTMLVSIMLIEFIACAALYAYRKMHSGSEHDSITSNPVFSQYVWASDLRKEEKLRLAAGSRTYMPFRVWGLTEWHGNYMNNDATEFGVIRRTLNPLRPKCKDLPKTNVWIFGGSTLYGTGVPDSLTLPSYLSRELNTTSCVEVTNFGVEGYVNNQELNVLEEELKAGHQPDIVIFYDGFNDALVGAINPGIPGTHIGYLTVKARLEGTVIGRLEFLRRSCAVQVANATIFNLFRPDVTPSEPGLRTKAIATVENFEQNLKIANALGNSHGFHVYAFWQPVVVFGHKPLTASEKRLVESSSNSATPFQAMIPVYEEAQRRAVSASDFVFLGNVFDEVQEALYFDWVHLSPRGNELAARAIAEYITAHDSVSGQGETSSKDMRPSAHHVGVRVRQPRASQLN